MMDPRYAPVRAPGREHIPRYPSGFIAIRIVQFILALIIIGLSAYGVSLLPFDGNVFIMVVGLFTLIICIYHIIAEFGAPSLHNYWAILALDIFMIIMWISSFALLASEVAVFFSYTYDYYYSSYNSYSSLGIIFSSVLAAASGLGGLEFVLFVISLSIHGVAVRRHRAAGLHCMPGKPPSPPTGQAALQMQQPVYAVPVAAVPGQFVPQQQPQFVPQPQPQFVPQQQVPGQFVQQQPMYAPPAAMPPQPAFTPTPPLQQGFVQPPPQQQQPMEKGPNDLQNI